MPTTWRWAGNALTNKRPGPWYRPHPYPGHQQPQPDGQYRSRQYRQTQVQEVMRGVVVGTGMAGARGVRTLDVHLMCRRGMLAGGVPGVGEGVVRRRHRTGGRLRAIGRRRAAKVMHGDDAQHEQAKDEYAHHRVAHPVGPAPHVTDNTRHRSDATASLAAWAIASSAAGKISRARADMVSTATA